jgi:hypothetical protein
MQTGALSRIARDPCGAAPKAPPERRDTISVGSCAVTADNVRAERPFYRILRIYMPAPEVTGSWRNLLQPTS